MFHKSAGTPHSKSGLNCLSVQQSVPIQIQMMHKSCSQSENWSLQHWRMFGGCLDVWFSLDVWWMFGCLVWFGCLVDVWRRCFGAQTCSNEYFRPRDPHTHTNYSLLGQLHFRHKRVIGGKKDLTETPMISWDTFFWLQKRSQKLL